MPIVISCPSCAKQVRVPENLIGTAVRCPSCQNAFTAQGSTGSDESVTPPPPPPPPGTQRRKREPEYRYEEDSPRSPDGGKYSRPERGVLVMLLGIGGLVCTVLSCFIGPLILIAFPLSLTAWILGRGDLKAIASGEMDPKAEGQTKGGWICGIIGTCVSALLIVCACIIVLLYILLVGVAVSSTH